MQHIPFYFSQYYFPMPLTHIFVDSIVGKLKLVAYNDFLCAVIWEDMKFLPPYFSSLNSVEDFDTPVLQNAKKQLEEYFLGERRSFDLPLWFSGTDFQKQVWKALTTIPCGETLSYQEIASKIGNSKAVRAVGAANRLNPIPIIAPCHRVIGKNGAMVGFAGGIDRKVLLLEFEKKYYG